MSRIIIADDDKTLQKIYQHIFEPLGHECRFFLNGRDAVNALREEWADLVILDCAMPVMNGYEACREIRAMPEAKELPIIIVSADDSQENILKLLNAGANDYVLKPVREAVLVTKLKNFLKTSALSGDVLEILHGKTEVADRYKVEKVLGYGAHSIVFLATDKEKDGGRVALKLLNRDTVSEPLLEKILQITSDLKNAAPFANIVNILDFGKNKEQAFIVLEYAEGGDFASKLKSDGLISERDSVAIALDCALGIAELAEKGMRHLDLKPENVLLTNGHCKLADFGIPMDDTTKTTAINSEIWSTVAYAAPEVFLESGTLSAKSDIYSLGVLIYESLTSDNPFKASKISASMFRQLNQQPPSLSLVAEKCSADLSRLVDSMLSKEQSGRPAPEELVTELQRIKSELDKGDAAELTYDDPEMLMEEAEALSPGDLDVNAENLIENSSDTSASSESEDELDDDELFALKLKKPRTKFERYANNFFIRIAAALVIFAAIFAATHLAQSLLAAPDEESELKGVPSVVICPKCGNIEVKPVVDIMKTHCSKCGAQEWFAYRCAKCGKIFPHDESKLNDSDIDDPDKLDEQEKCPYCGSHDIIGVTPKSLKRLRGKQ